MTEPNCILVRSHQQTHRFVLTEIQERLYRLAYNVLALSKEPLSLGCTVFIEGRACFPSTKLGKRSVNKQYIVFFFDQEGVLTIEKMFGYQLRYLQPCWVSEYYFKFCSTKFLALLYLHGAKLRIRQSVKEVILSQVAKIVYRS